MPLHHVHQVGSVWAGEPTPDLACLVGFLSIDSEAVWRVNCSQASQHSLIVSRAVRKELGWPQDKTEIV